VHDDPLSDDNVDHLRREAVQLEEASVRIDREGEDE
jgi:hypothetical protein